jgi:hypothetical protein
MAGYPSITVPMGFVSGLLLGLCFSGAAWAEPTLLRLAYAYEQSTQHRKPPTFAETFVSLSSDRPNKRPDAGRPGPQSGASWGCLPTIRAPESRRTR